MRTFARFVLVAAASLGLTAAAQAKVKIDVDLDNQTMHVESNDKVFDWKISSGRSGGYETPDGAYGVLWTDKDHLSDEYDQAPMPNAIFFKPGYAIHGAYKSDWGHPASHGCIRLPVAKSAILFDMVKKDGAEINITGTTPETTIAGRRHRHDDAVAADAEPMPAPSRGYQDADAYEQPVPAPAPIRQPTISQGFGGLFGGIY